MDEKLDFARYLQLKEDLSFYSYRYHVLDEPLISDVEYDRLYHELKTRSGLRRIHPLSALDQPRLENSLK
jgi:NAD-dependent DNA ligase